MEEKEVFTQLKHQAINASAMSIVYDQLFGDEESITLINSCGSQFFYEAQKAMHNMMILYVCKMTDPHKQGSNSNLSIKRLINQIKDKHPDLVSDMENKLDEIPANVRKLRSKVIAHNDLDAFKDDYDLEGIGAKDLKKCMELISEALNLYDVAIHDNTTLYERTILNLASDGDYLKTKLRKAHAFDAASLIGMVDHDMWKDYPVKLDRKPTE